MNRLVYWQFAAAAALCTSATACREAPRCAGNPCGTAVVLVTADASVLFPPLTQSNTDFAVSDLLFLKLADIGLGLNTIGDAGFEPRLARSWKFEDPLTLSFQLDPRAHWQDGVPVTAADVAFTFDIYRDTLVNSPVRPLLDQIASVTARDERTAVFRFRRAYSERFYDATHQMQILPRHLLDSIPRARLGSHPFARRPIGDGPYRLVTWNAGQSIELAADTGFFLGRPGLARLIWRVTPDYNTAITQLVANEADFMDYLGPPENVARVAAAPQLRIMTYPSAAYTFLDLNQWDPVNLSRSHPLFSDRDLRRALGHAVDRAALIQAVVGKYGTLALGPTNRLTAIGNDSTLPQLAFDVAAARSTLERLGWRTSGSGIRERGGRRLEFELLVPTSSQTRRRMAVVLQEQLKSVGVGVKISELELNLFLQRINSRKFDAMINTFNGDPSPSGIQQTFTTAGIGKFNYRGYSNPRFDRLVAAAVAATDPAIATAKWREAFTVIDNDAPGIWLYNPIQASGIHRRYENVTIRPDQWTATLWTWRVSPGKLIPRDLVAASAPASP